MSMRRSLLVGAQESPTTSPLDFKIVAETMAALDLRFEPQANTNATQKIFENMLCQNLFSLAPSVLAKIPQPYPCLFEHTAFHLNDDFDDIFWILRRTSAFLQQGVSVAIDFSYLRAARSVIRSSHLQSLGPVRFMELFEQAPQNQNQQTHIHFALAIDHLDIEAYFDYIRHASPHIHFTVGITQSFVDALKDNTDLGLKHQRDSDISKSVSAESLFERLCTLVSDGYVARLIFLDHLENHKVTHSLSPDLLLDSQNFLIESGEFVASGELHLKNVLMQTGAETLPHVFFDAVHFLDNLFEKNFFFDDEAKKTTLKNRRLNLRLVNFVPVIESLCQQNELRLSQKKITKIVDACFFEFLKASAQIGAVRGATHRESLHGESYRTRHIPILTASPDSFVTQEAARMWQNALRQHSTSPLSEVFLEETQDLRQYVLEANQRGVVVTNLSNHICAHGGF